MKQVLFVFSVVVAFVAAFFVAVPFVSAATAGTGSIRIQYNVTTGKTTTTTTNRQVSGTGEYIDTYETESAIHADGSVSVTERILYNFPEPRHGIFRTIPYVKTNADGKKYALTIIGMRVTDDEDKPYQFATTDDGTSLTYKIGDPDTTIDGSHWYVLTYDVKGALTYFPGHDELYWNAVGTTWKVPILHATSAVLLPASLAATEVNSDCFVGTQGSKEKFCTSSYAAGNVSVKATRPLGPYEGFTYVVGFPKNTVAVLEPKELVPFFETR